MARNARKYKLGLRAEQQAETRLRIVEAAVELHGTVGPARTSFSMVAEYAGVQRNTLYAHFPDERALLIACSGLSMERDPPPDAAPWRDIADKDKRLRTGLRAIYDWYARGAQLLSCVMRDAESHPIVREVSELRYGPVVGSYVEVLGAGLNARQRVMLGLALSFFTWRTLSRDAGLMQAAAVSAMAQAIEASG
jgi:AcrR family transcriptional regulator